MSASHDLSYASRVSRKASSFSVHGPDRCYVTCKIGMDFAYSFSVCGYTSVLKLLENAPLIRIMDYLHVVG